MIFDNSACVKEKKNIRYEWCLAYVSDIMLTFGAQRPVSRRFILLLLVVLVLFLPTKILQPSHMVCPTSPESLHRAIRALTDVQFRFSTLFDRQRNPEQQIQKGPLMRIPFGAHLHLRKGGSVKSTIPEIGRLIARCNEAKNRGL